MPGWVYTLSNGEVVPKTGRAGCGEQACVRKEEEKMEERGGCFQAGEQREGSRRWGPIWLKLR